MADPPQPLNAFPTLAVTDLAASTRFYRQALGFELVAELAGAPSGLDDPAGAVHLRWISGGDLFLLADSAEAPAARPDERRGLGVTLTFTLASGRVDELAARAQAFGAEVLLPPTDRPWNVREVIILDPDRYRLLFTQRLDPERHLAALAVEMPVRAESGAVKPRRRPRRPVIVRDR